MADRIVGIRVKVIRCNGCRRLFRYPLHIIEGAESSPCNCGATSVRYVREARPIGPRSARWREECRSMGVNPRTGRAPSYLARCTYFKWKGAPR